MSRGRGTTNFESGGVPFSMRRTDQDRRPPRRVLTGYLMGDPRPDRLERAEAVRAAHGRERFRNTSFRVGGHD